MTKLQSENLQLSERLHKAERELRDQHRKSGRETQNASVSRSADLSKESVDLRVYLDRITAVEKKVDSVKEKIGEFVVGSSQALQAV